MSTAAPVPPTADAMEAAADELMAEEAAGAVPVAHADNATAESPPKRARKVRQPMESASMASTSHQKRAVEV